MRGTSRFVTFTVVVLAGSVLAGCASRKTATYDNEGFNESSTYSRSYTSTATDACESARRALLSQGYVITKVQPDVVDGRKKFQQASEAHAEIEFHIVCAPDSSDGTSSTVFVNAVQDRYTLKKTASSASLGVSLLGSVSMPFGASDDSMVKVGSETIAAPRFYNGFFGLLEQYLAPLQARAAAQAAQAQAAQAQAAQAQAAAAAKAAQAQAIASAEAAKAQAAAAAQAQAAAAAQAQAAATAQAQAAATAQAHAATAQAQAASATQAQVAAAAQTQAAAGGATDTKQVELKPIEAAAAEAKAAEFKAAESKAAEFRSADAKPADSKRVDTTPADAKPADTTSEAAKPATGDAATLQAPNGTLAPATTLPAGNGAPAN